MIAARALVMFVDLSLEPADTNRGGVHGSPEARRQADSRFQESTFSSAEGIIDIIL
jgi:hypothetical protein